MKVGRNAPCPCENLKPDGAPVKYKKCCYLQLAKKAPKTKNKLPKFTREMLIGGPYTQCPNCHKIAFGVDLFSNGDATFNKECTKCGHVAKLKLPVITKRIIYIDQFVFDNIVKSLDTQHPKHAKLVSEEPFWLEVFKKVLS